eukprot:1203148-Rhodomonas_salina.2
MSSSFPDLQRRILSARIAPTRMAGDSEEDAWAYGTDGEFLRDLQTSAPALCLLTHYVMSGDDAWSASTPGGGLGSIYRSGRVKLSQRSTSTRSTLR